MALHAISGRPVQDKASEISRQSARYASSVSAEEALRPIRIGAEAVQPPPDSTTLLYVGLASLMPEHLRALCSCAGLFFACVWSRGGGKVDLEVTALPEYFDADSRTRNRHVRTIALTTGQFAHLVEWDRRLASMAMSDVRELVEEHAVQVQAAQQLRPALIEVGISLQAEVPVYVQPPASPHHDEKQEEASYIAGPTVTLSVDTIQGIWAKIQQHRTQSLRLLPVLLLQAALSVAEHLDEQALIRRVLVWRDRIPPKMEVTPIFARERTGQPIVGYRVQVRVPVSQVA